MNNSALWIVLNRMRAPIMVLLFTYTIAIVGLLIIDGRTDTGEIYQMSIFDAFYLVTYTATTIGFGELPYPFTPAQRIWMSMIVYATVLGWFYSIGSFIALLQDKLLIAQLAHARFKKQVKNIHQHFLIVLGYNYITSEIIKKANVEGVRTIVIEKDINRINELHLENYTPIVPCLMADVYDPLALEQAGLNSKYCKAVVSLFTSDTLNLRVALTTKLLNKNVVMAVKSTTEAHAGDLRDVGVEIVENPFEIIAEQIEMSIRNPHMLVLQNWIYGVGHLRTNIVKLPKGKYIVCGFGRMGKVLFDILNDNGIDAVFIEPDKKAIRGLSKEIKDRITIGTADDKELLVKLGIYNATGIIAGTADDTQNLSILTSARRVNPNLITIARENEIEDSSVFENAKIDLVFIPRRVLIYKTTNALIAPYSSKFLEIIKAKKDSNYTEELVNKLINVIGYNPITFGITINDEKAHAIYNAIKKDKKTVKLEVLAKSGHDYTKHNKIIPLILIRGKDEYLLPSCEMELELHDKVLFAADEESMNDAKDVAQNIYEFHYVHTGEEKDSFAKFFKRKK